MSEYRILASEFSAEIGGFDDRQREGKPVMRATYRMDIEDNLTVRQIRFLPEAFSSYLE